MSLVEKALADNIVRLRHQESQGVEHVTIDELIGALDHHLRREQHWRSVVHEMTGGDR